MFSLARALGGGGRRPSASITPAWPLFNEINTRLVTTTPPLKVLVFNVQQLWVLVLVSYYFAFSP